jgi:hypothetical protein
VKLAYCNGIRQFHANRLADRAWASRYPGAGWVSVLHQRAVRGGHEIASGDVALERVRRGEWSAADVHVLQELDSWHGMELCRLGARPTLLMSLESPLVAFRSFDHLRRKVAPFAHVMGPSLLLSDGLVARAAQLHPLTFPSFWMDTVVQQDDRPRSSGLVLVAANKHWSEGSPAGLVDFRTMLRWIRRGLRRRLSPTYRAVGACQLHDERLRVIETLSRQSSIQVWGKGWDVLDNLPAASRERIATCGLCWHGPCEDKATVLKGFDFALAYENTACHGYVTEKIIDAIHAGCVPIYRGAPDVHRIVPQDAFVEATGLAATSDPMRWIMERSSGRMESIRRSGREFLNSPAGQRHSHEGFASWVLELCVSAQGGGTA